MLQPGLWPGLPSSPLQQEEGKAGLAPGHARTELLAALPPASQGLGCVLALAPGLGQTLLGGGRGARPLRCSCPVLGPKVLVAPFATISRRADKTQHTLAR